jgi:dihydrofolate reductase
MRKLVLFMHVSLDGFAAVANGGLDWISYDRELQQYADGIVATVGSPVYGRVTYELNDNIAEEINKLKQQPGKDLVIFGSPGLAHSLMELDLIDEYQLTLNPVLLGSGIPAYQNIKNKTKLKLVKATSLKNGVDRLRHYLNKLCLLLFKANYYYD